MQFLPPAFAAMAAFNQFVLYIVVPSTSRPGKTDKIPIDYRTGRKTGHQDKNIWLDAATAIKLAAQYKSQFGHGVGFVLTEQDPFWLLDIDSCLELNTWSSSALSFAAAFSGAAVEISNSKKGLHIIGTGRAPMHSCRSTVLTNIEFYTSNRFVALTGEGVIGDAGLDCTQNLPWLVDNYFNPKTNGVHGTWSESWDDAYASGPCSQWAGPADDVILIERALRSQSARAAFGNAATFRDLWEGNILKLAQVYGGDESSYDAALAQHLAFWTGNDAARMQRLMRQSALVREKWEREDYLPRTIISARAKQTEWLQDKPPQPLERVTPQAEAARGRLVTGSTYLTIEQQLELFAGCTYVCDAHKILVPGGTLLKPDQFRVMYGGYSFTVDPANARVTRNAWEAFTESQAFQSPRADSSCFRPDLTPGAVVPSDGRLLANLWWPVETKRVQGDIAPFLSHLKRVLPDPRDQMILLSYMAACVQHKGIKFQWAPLLQGVEGNGKTLFTRCVAYAIGDKYTHFPKAAEIATKFNDWMYCKIFIGVEDIYVPDSQREVLEALKPMITRERQEIEPKGGAKITLDVCCNFILNSNHKDGIKKTRNNRIFAPLYTAQQTAEDLARDGMQGDYFPNLYDWLRLHDGYAIVSDYLHLFEIPAEFNPAGKCQRAPLTSSTEDAIAQSMGGIEQEILEAIDQGVAGFKGGWVSSIALDRLLERLHAGRRIPHNKRRDLLKSLGFDWHPGLTSGRTNNITLPDGGKPRLFIRTDHPHLSVNGAAEIARLYSDAQIV